MSNKLFGREAYRTKTVNIGGLRIHSSAFYKQRGRNGRECYATIIYCRRNRTEFLRLHRRPFYEFGRNNKITSKRIYFKITNK